MKRIIHAIVASAVLAACVTPPATFQGSEVKELVEEVVGMHNSYVEQDPALELETAQGYLQEASNLWALAAYEQIYQNMFQTVAEPIFDRYDGYISTDVSLLPLERRVYLRSTEILREFYPEE